MPVSLLSDVPSWVISGIIGAGSAYGTFQYMRGKMEEQIKTISRIQGEVLVRVKNLEDRGYNLVFKPECDKDRLECQTSICKRLDEVKTAVEENRENAEKRHEKLMERIGYITAKLEKI